MSYQSRVQCDRCKLDVDAPQDGGFPPGWSEINIKPSLRGRDPIEKRRRLHFCDKCTTKLLIWKMEATEPMR